MVYKNGIDTAKIIVEEVDNKVKRIYWTNNEIDKWFGKRSAKEIINSGHTCFMNPCSDLTLASSFIMDQNNIPHQWVVEEYLPTENFNFNRLHFVLEFKHNDKLYVLNYQKLNDVYIHEGGYNGRPDLPAHQTIKFPSKQIDFNKSLHKNITNSNLVTRLGNYSLKNNLNKLKQDNSMENYNNFKKLYGENFIIKEPESQP